MLQDSLAHLVSVLYCYIHDTIHRIDKLEIPSYFLPSKKTSDHFSSLVLKIVDILSMLVTDLATLPTSFAQQR